MTSARLQMRTYLTVGYGACSFYRYLLPESYCFAIRLLRADPKQLCGQQHPWKLKNEGRPERSHTERTRCEA